MPVLFPFWSRRGYTTCACSWTADEARGHREFLCREECGNRARPEAHGLGCVEKKFHKISLVVVPTFELKSGL
jgi:hypothetical protein